MIDCPHIALTGGPCGGKTTLLCELRAADPRGERWILVPEAAPLLFQAGLDGGQPSFQRAVVQLQIALEGICAAAASPQQVLLCHRGTLDALAYWLRNGWDEGEFFAATGMSREEHYRRYFGVIHLQTAAIGAEGYYRRWPDAHRPETIEQAAEIDRLCARAWSDHPRYVLVDSFGKDWLAKSCIALETLTRWLALASE
jgi:predicted ATPase